MITINQTISDVTMALKQYLPSQVNAAQEARWLVAHVLGYTPTQLHLHHTQVVSDPQRTIIDDLVDQRINQHTPLAYLLGSAPFCDLDITVRTPVLIPRPETEEMVTWLIEKVNQHHPTKPLRILDLCTGSGCIALALAHHLPHTQVIGVDISHEALALAQENKQQLELNNVTFAHSDMFAAVADQEFDIIVSNPPYLSNTEWDELTPDVKDWESKTALVATKDGLAFYDAIARNAHQFLTPHTTPLPSLVLEIGHAQKDAVAGLLNDNGFTGINTYVDLFGLDRWITGQL